MRNVLDVRRLWLRKLIKIHSFALAVFLGVYFLFAFLDPGLLSYDARQKFSALADELLVVTATVLAPPVQPVVTATADCNNSTGVLSVVLDWADDANSYTFDIDRDGMSLISGLINSAYIDTNVVVATTYQYEVTGNGPMGPGFATSVPISVTTPTECEVTAAVPTATIVSFAGRGIDSYGGSPRTKNRRPTFTGTTNIPNANVLVTIGTSFLAELTANSNGYWEWKPPYGVVVGKHIFTVVVTDPNDTARSVTVQLEFRIFRESEDEGKRASTKNNEQAPLVPGRSEEEQSPIEFTLLIENSSHSVEQGGMLWTLVRIDSLLNRYAHLIVPVRYSILDRNGGILFSETKKSYITQGEEIRTTLPIAAYFNPGEHVLQVEIFLDTINISRTLPFDIVELPLIRLSSGDSVSYADIIRNLGWITLAFLVFFFFWLLLFIREFAFFLQGERKITEYDLKKAGLIRK